jgi:hypothetical protein
MENWPKVRGEIDLEAIAISVPRLSSFSGSHGGGDKEPTLPPGKIDLEAIAIRVPRSRYWRDPVKVQATRRRNIAARQKQRLEVWKAKRRASWEPSRGGPARWYSRSLGDRLLCVMEPGEWYGLRDLTEALGVHRNSVKPWLYGAGSRRLVGLVQKGRNRDFKGRLDPWALMGGVECEPQFLWGLTEAGERARQLALLLE